MSRIALAVGRTRADLGWGGSGYQYAAFYVTDAVNASVRHPSLSRRALSGDKTSWETFSFTEYNQTDDDGHNTCVCLYSCSGHAIHPVFSISIGISHGDGTLHMGFDQHDNNLNYRVSKAGVATNPTKVAWSSDLFGPVLVCSHLLSIMLRDFCTQLDL